MSKPITVMEVKELREAIGATMQECMRALRDTHGDFDAALRKLRDESDEGERVLDDA